MIKLTNPKIAHADAVIRLAGRLLHESERLIEQVAHLSQSSHEAQELKEKIQFHTIVLREMIKQEHDMIHAETYRIGSNFQIGSLKQHVELKTLKAQALKLNELSFLTEKQRAATLTPSPEKNSKILLRP